MNAMIYQSGSAFRRALEQRLNAKTISTGIPLVRLRKTVAFDRFLARLISAQPESWALKGGLAMQLRLGERSRTTKDIDLLSFAMENQVLSLLRKAASQDLKDWFSFEVSAPVQQPHPGQNGLRYTTQTLLDGRLFESFHVDVGVGDPVVEPLEYLAITDLLSFADLSPTIAPCYPITQQIAEKFHAYTKPRKSGESSRVKDLVDILLLAELQSLSGVWLRQSIQATFSTARTHPIPKNIPIPPGNWASEFRRLASDTGLTPVVLDQAYQLLQAFLDPVLVGEPPIEWDPKNKLWT
jgi:hypothetical protein